MDRDSRRLSHGKGNKIVTQVNVPLSSDGDDGDQKIVGSTLYTKSEGQWIGFKSTDTSTGQIGKWVNLELLTNWTNYNNLEYMTAGVMIDEIGMVHLRGTITNSSDRSEHICTLPPLYRPHRSVNAVVMCDGAAGANVLRCYIDNYNTYKGNIWLVNAPTTSSWVTLDSITWWVGKERLRQ